MLRLGNALIEDTYAELFNMWVGRVIITAQNEKWCRIAAEVATGYASSIIGSPAEAGIEGDISPDETPDGRVGKIIQIYHTNRSELKKQMIGRIGQCIMTCPTTAAFDGLPKASRRLKVGRSLRLFGDGFQERDELFGRKVWRIPVMEGKFIVEDSFGVMKGVAGGNFLIFSRTLRGGLEAAEKAVEAIKRDVKYVILPFPGGVCRSGSKVGSIKYKLPASTNHPFCPSLRGKTQESRVPDDVNCIYEIVINGLDLESVKEAMRTGIRAAVKIPDVVRISAGNYGGKIGPMKIFLHDVLK